MITFTETTSFRLQHLDFFFFLLSAQLGKNLTVATPKYEDQHRNWELVSQDIGTIVSSSSVFIGQERLFQCPFCRKILQQRHQFVGHVNMHLKIAPFKCKLCLKSFPYRTSLSRHTRTHHKPSC